MTEPAFLGFFCVRWRANGQINSVYSKSYLKSKNFYLTAKTKSIEFVFISNLGCQVISSRR